MERITKKTTILLQPELHRRLASLATQRRTSIGELIRSAVERQYGLGGNPERISAARALAALSLPVADPAVMKRESSPAPEDLVP
ncbi:MAG: hypothetical protein FIA95_16635 [Gemmatimonadetes bacterium]|nr:hypothetical protein [Gemmatimonadota bacterium]